MHHYDPTRVYRFTEIKSRTQPNPSPLPPIFRFNEIKFSRMSNDQRATMTISAARGPFFLSFRSDLDGDLYSPRKNPCRQIKNVQCENVNCCYGRVVYHPGDRLAEKRAQDAPAWLRQRNTALGLKTRPSAPRSSD
jgi:hypothetical protein